MYETENEHWYLPEGEMSQPQKQPRKKREKAARPQKSILPLSATLSYTPQKPAKTLLALHDPNRKGKTVFCAYGNRLLVTGLDGDALYRFDHVLSLEGILKQSEAAFASALAIAESGDAHLPQRHHRMLEQAFVLASQQKAA